MWECHHAGQMGAASRLAAKQFATRSRCQGPNQRPNCGSRLTASKLVILSLKGSRAVRRAMG